MNSPKADWLAWVLQFIFGGVVGLVLGFYAISCRSHYYATGSSYLLESRDVMPFLIGASLLGGALASYFGDRLWMEDRVIPNDPVPQSHNSFALSVTIGAVGVGLMGCAILRTVGWMGR